LRTHLTGPGRRPEVRAKVIVGAATQVVSCVPLPTMRLDSAIWQIVLVTVVFGIPQGLNNLATRKVLYHQADPERSGTPPGCRAPSPTSPPSPLPSTARSSATSPTPPPLHRISAFLAQRPGT
jgi:hypothetical protein